MKSKFSFTPNGHVLPTLPTYPESKKVTITQAGQYAIQTVPENLTTTQNDLFGKPMFFPLEIKAESQPNTAFWLLPVEPMITITGGAQIIKRNVAKASATGSKLRGTIKEVWQQEDYNITIDGLFTKVDDWSYPESDVQKLIALLERREAIDVICELFNYFRIFKIVVEKWDFPFTKGEENQRYSLSAVSDDPWELFIEVGAKAIQPTNSYKNYT